jgi:hypothetical protein
MWESSQGFDDEESAKNDAQFWLDNNADPQRPAFVARAGYLAWDAQAGTWDWHEVHRTQAVKGAPVVTGDAQPIPPLPVTAQYKRLPDGQDVGIKGGLFYSGQASVKKTHSKQDLKDLAWSKWGLLAVQFVEQGDPPQANQPILPTDPDPSYKRVFFIAYATKDAGNIPWSVPWFVPGDSSHLLEMWFAPPGKSAPVPAPTPEASSNAVPIALAVVGVVGVTGLAWWLLARRRHAHASVENPRRVSQVGYEQLVDRIDGHDIYAVQTRETLGAPIRWEALLSTPDGTIHRQAMTMWRAVQEVKRAYRDYKSGKLRLGKWRKTKKLASTRRGGLRGRSIAEVR